MLTPQQATKILTKQFNNKENLHRITTEQAQEINSLILVMNCKAEIMRSELLRMANKWYIQQLFPWVARELRRAAVRTMPELVEAIKPDETPMMVTFKRPE